MIKNKTANKKRICILNTGTCKYRSCHCYFQPGLSELHPPAHLFCTCNYTFTVKNSLAYPYLLWALFSRFSEKLMLKFLCNLRVSKVDWEYLFNYSRKQNKFCELINGQWVHAKLIVKFGLCSLFLWQCFVVKF